MDVVDSVAAEAVIVEDVVDLAVAEVVTVVDVEDSVDVEAVIAEDVEVRVVSLRTPISWIASINGNPSKKNKILTHPRTWW